MAADSSVLSKYRAGFNECASEISRYLGTIDGLDTDVRARLLCHLSTCVSSINTAAPQVPSYQANQQMHSQFQPIQLQIPSSTATAALPGSSTSNQIVNCMDPNVLNSFQSFLAANGGKFPGAVQLMPATMPTGGVALVVPAQAVHNFSASPNGNSHGLVYGNSMPTNFAFSPVQCSSPIGSPNSSVSSEACGQMSPASSIGSPSRSPSPKLDINHNAIPPAEVCVKEESMWRPW